MSPILCDINTYFLLYIIRNISLLPPDNEYENESLLSILQDERYKDDKEIGNATRDVFLSVRNFYEFLKLHMIYRHLINQYNRRNFLAPVL